MASFFTIGLNNGIDFTGGRNYIVRFDQPVQTDNVRGMLSDQLDGAVSVITIGSADQVRISTNYKIADSNAEVDREIETKLYEGLKPLLKEGTTLDHFVDTYIQSSQKVVQVWLTI
jgi:SecD/SecF fusion protein